MEYTEEEARSKTRDDYYNNDNLQNLIIFIVSAGIIYESAGTANLSAVSEIFSSISTMFSTFGEDYPTILAFYTTTEHFHDLIRAAAKVSKLFFKYLALVKKKLKEVSIIQ
jgi:hypothetical protein